MDVVSFAQNLSAHDSTVMSTDYEPGLIEEYEQNLFNNRVVYATAALVIYEHLITFKYEIDFLWRRKWSGATWIFMFNRYFLLVHVLASIMPYSAQTCYNALAMNIFSFFTYVTIPSLPVHAFTVMRGFALLQNRVWRFPIISIMVALALAVTVCDAYEDFTESWEYIDDPVLGSSCYQTGFFVSPTVIERLTEAGAVLGIILAAITLVITWIATARQVLQVSSLRLKTTLSQILLRDGSMFFILIELEDILAAVGTYMALSGPAVTIVINLLDLLPLLLLSRFIINLREVDSPTTHLSDDQHPSRFSIPNFRMPTLDDVVGNLGEPLDFVEYRVEQDGDGEHEYAPTIDGMDSEAAQGDVEGPLEPTVTDVEGTGPSESGYGGVVAFGQGVDVEQREPRLSPARSA